MVKWNMCRKVYWTWWGMKSWPAVVFLKPTSSWSYQKSNSWAFPVSAIPIFCSRESKAFFYYKKVFCTGCKLTCQCFILLFLIFYKLFLRLLTCWNLRANFPGVFFVRFAECAENSGFEPSTPKLSTILSTDLVENKCAQNRAFCTVLKRAF